MKNVDGRRSTGHSRLLGVVLVTACAAWSIGAGPGSTLVRLTGHVPATAVARATHIGRMPATAPVSLAVVLNTNQTALAQLISELHDPADPHYGHYLTTAQFAQQFGASQQTLTEVKQYLQDRGLKVGNVHANGLVIEASGAAADVENAFQVELHQYQSREGTLGYAPLNDPLIPDSLASQIQGIVGLSSLTPHTTHLLHSHAAGRLIGNGVDSGLEPSDIKTAYNLNGITQTGTGQTLALFELDGYTASDITTYEQEYGVPAAPTLTNMLVDGATGTPSTNSEGSLEVTIDIELMVGIASGATQILVYEGPNSDAGALATYSKIASDNSASQISTSWGEAEDESAATTVQGENTIFMQMAAQGQTIYAAAGDFGAYDDGTSLSVDDPASQPYVTGTGGTTLTVAAAEAYSKEITWSSGSVAAGDPEGGGGGISGVWTIPSYQAALGTATNLGSTTMRMMPDVALNADPNSGYSFYEKTLENTSVGFNIVGGTSCAAPIWAAFTALVNQARVAAKLPVLGFANPTIYQLASSSVYETSFHDIADGSTNLHYPAVTGYDLATGWGSMNGGNLFKALTLGTLPPYPPAGLAAAPYNKVASLSWTAASGATSYAVSRGTASTGPFTVVAPSVSGITYQDTGLTDGTTYYYTISAGNIAGHSGNSAVQSTAPELVPPRAPGSFTASKGAF